MNIFYKPNQDFIQYETQVETSVLTVTQTHDVWSARQAQDKLTSWMALLLADRPHESQGEDSAGTCYLLNICLSTGSKVHSVEVG